MRKLLTLAMIMVATFAATSTYAAIWGSLSVCVGGTSTLFPDSASTGTWSSSNVAVATIGSSTGLTTGVAAGTCIISWNGSLGLSTAVFTVNPAPGAIGGGTTPICIGATTTLTNPVIGGSWSSSPTIIATVGIATGIVTGVNGGTANIYYSVGTGAGCFATKVVTVNPAGADTITGTTSVCAGSSITLSSTVGGGTWSSSSTGIATVSGSGVVTGVAAGTVTITHTTTGSCGTITATRVITVTTTTSPGTITGSTTLTAGSTSYLYNSVSGGTWSSSTTSVATIGATTGFLTAVASGTAVITYTKTGCSGPASTYTTVTVTSPNCISGDVLFTGPTHYGSVKVWLIKYNPATHILSACDSTYAYASGTSAHYSFCGMSTDSFRVKAATNDSAFTTTGYTPTYHTASTYWNSATVIYHVAGTNDINKNITMGYGTVTAGLGFIAGDVTTGANKGTAGIPAVGMLIYCVNISTGAILQQTYTNALGHYSFSNLPMGEPFRIYPEQINYNTTAYPPIVLTSSNPTMMSASFIQHTLSMTITPITTGIINTSASAAGITLYPNPTSSVLNIEWSNLNNTTAEISITDITGREIMKTTTAITQANGTAPLNLSGLTKGIYMISIKANGVNYNNKIQIQ